MNNTRLWQLLAIGFAGAIGVAQAAAPLATTQSEFVVGTLSFKVAGISLTGYHQAQASIVIENRASEFVYLEPAFVKQGKKQLVDLSIANETGQGCNATSVNGLRGTTNAEDVSEATPIPPRARATITVEFRCGPLVSEDMLSINGSVSVTTGGISKGVPISFWGLAPRAPK